MPPTFLDRREAGTLLAQELASYQGQKDVLVLALPRGGVAVAAEIARALKLPLDLMLVRKLGVPGDEEFAFGAIAMGGVVFLNEDTIRLARILREDIDTIIERETEELARRNGIYRKGAPPPEVKGQTIILVDDGMATGADMLVAARAVRQQGAARVIVAVPVSSDQAFAMLKKEADDILSLLVPPVFFGVGMFYQTFDQMDDDEVLALMEEARRALT